MFLVLALPAARAVTPPTPAAEQRVVYVTPGYALHTVRADGTERSRLTEGGLGGGVLAQPLPQQTTEPRFTWPTWSPDGTRLVASQTSGLDRRQRAALALLTPPSREPAHLHATGLVPLDRVADGTPHYALWSPDGSRLSLIAPNRRGTALVLSILDPDTGEAEDVAAGAPMYYAWSPDGEIMAIHRRQTLYLRDRDGRLVDPERSSVRYRAPSFSADGLSLAFMADEGRNGKLIVWDLTEGGVERTLLTTTTGATAFAFSPVEPHLLAVAVTNGTGFAGYDRLVLYDTRTGDERVLYDAPTFAFWWSPDASKLAVVTANADVLEWVVVDVATGASRSLGQFVPSVDFLTYIQFFDQFALSHLVWSEDSTALTFAGQLRHEAQTDTTPRAWVLDAAGETAPRPLAPALQSYFVPTGKALADD